ncbi:hypothetical protein BDR22DRAFT_902249 [Usnea florida]
MNKLVRDSTTANPWEANTLAATRYPAGSSQNSERSSGEPERDMSQAVQATKFDVFENSLFWMMNGYPEDERTKMAVHNIASLGLCPKTIPAENKRTRQDVSSHEEEIDLFGRFQFRSLDPRSSPEDLYLWIFSEFLICRNIALLIDDNCIRLQNAQLAGDSISAVVVETMESEANPGHLSIPTESLGWPIGPKSLPPLETFHLQFLPLNCLSDFWRHRNVWVFGRADRAPPRSRAYLSTDIETFADVLRPVWSVADQSSPDMVVTYNAGEGSIAIWFVGLLRRHDEFWMNTQIRVHAQPPPGAYELFSKVTPARRLMIAELLTVKPRKRLGHWEYTDERSETSEFQPMPVTMGRFL